MITRQALGKKIRFEVFKRDKFTCQYCGGKAPDIVLQCDHIDPVAGGGDNEITNLITSCFDCNSGKSDRKLDDNTVVEKQRKQLEILQERREQIELMLEWKKSLESFDNDVVEMIADYINSKIKPHTVNDSGKKNISKWLKKFSTEKILDGVDEAAKTYLKYKNGEVDNGCVELFFNKISGVIVVKGMPPIKQKIAYIKGIAKNRFQYWDNKTGAIILDNYVAALQDYGWNEGHILKDLEDEVIKVTKEAKNWSDWRSTLEGWTEDIKKWEKPNSEPTIRYGCYSGADHTFDELERHANMVKSSTDDRIECLIHIGSVFPNFSRKAFLEDAITDIRSFIDYLPTIYDDFPEEADAKEARWRVEMEAECSTISSYFDFHNLPDDGTLKLGVLEIFNEQADKIIEGLFYGFYFSRFFLTRKDIDILLELLRRHYDE